MMPVAYYLLKVALCSGVLTGYYWLALRNKPFHQWNRFYLLAAVMLSLVAPVLEIKISGTNAAAPTQVLRLLHVAGSDAGMEVESQRSSAFALAPEQWVLLGYMLVSALLATVAAAHGVRVWRIIKNHPKTRLGDVLFLNTDAPGTPFSLFRYVVWNKNIDIAAEAGQRIFRHEVAHVQQRHSWDKLFLTLMLILFWANPVFWIIRRELHALHEFAADEEALGSHDATALAQLILNASYPAHHRLFTNPFFQSTLKRRLLMFQKLKNPKVGYISRIAALPLILTVLTAFAIRLKQPDVQGLAVLDQPITVVIDAGHGGNTGAQIDGIYEDDLTLAIAKKIKEQNANTNIRIVLTRESEANVDLQKRVDIAAANKADLFISVHINAATPDAKGSSEPTSGFEVMVPSKNPAYQQQSKALGSALVQQFSTIRPIRQNLVRKKISAWVLEQNVCPAVLVECGYLTDQADLNFIRQEQNQKVIADKILAAIAQYGVLKKLRATAPVPDTVPKLVYNGKEVKNVFYIRDEKDKAEVIYQDGTREFITAADARRAKLLNADTNQLVVFTPPVMVKDTVPAKMYKNKPVADMQYFEWPKKQVVVLFADGTKKSLSYAEAKAANLLGDSDIAAIERRAWANEKVDTKIAADGELHIRTATLAEARDFTGPILLNDQLYNSSFEDLYESEKEIAFMAVIKGSSHTFEKEFGVQSGDSLLAVSTKEFVEANRQTGNEPLFTDPEVAARFPQTDGGWAAFLMKNLRGAAPKAKGAPPGTYKVVVGFIVDTDGSLHDIKPATQHGYGMEEEVIRVLRLSPKWMPAQQNGKAVSSYVNQPVTLVISK